MSTNLGGFNQGWNPFEAMARKVAALRNRGSASGSAGGRSTVHFDAGHRDAKAQFAMDYQDAQNAHELKMHRATVAGKVKVMQTASNEALKHPNGAKIQSGKNTVHDSRPRK